MQIGDVVETHFWKILSIVGTLLTATYAQGIITGHDMLKSDILRVETKVDTLIRMRGGDQ